MGEFFQQQICSLKIEGRMKSAFYVGLTCKAYRQLIDAYAAGTWSLELLQQVAAELQGIPHRNYGSGSLATPAGADSVFDRAAGVNTGNYDYLGLVLSVSSEEIVLRLLEPLAVGEEIEIIPFQGPPVRWQIQQLYAATGESVASMRQDSIVRIPLQALGRSPDSPTTTAIGHRRSEPIAGFNLAQFNLAKFNLVRVPTRIQPSQPVGQVI